MRSSGLKPWSTCWPTSSGVWPGWPASTPSRSSQWCGRVGPVFRLLIDFWSFTVIYKLICSRERQQQWVFCCHVPHSCVALRIKLWYICDEDTRNISISADERWNENSIYLFFRKKYKIYIKMSDWEDAEKVIFFFLKRRLKLFFSNNCKLMQKWYFVFNVTRLQITEH